MKTTLIEDYGLVCEKAGLRTIYNSIYMLGMLFGSYIFGWISDRFGRMKALMLSTVAVSLGHSALDPLVSTFTPSSASSPESGPLAALWFASFSPSSMWGSSSQCS